MAKSKNKPAEGVTDGIVVSDPAPAVPATETPSGLMILQAGPNASDGTFGMRISDDIRLEIGRGQQVEVPPTLEYEAVCKVRGPDFGKRITKSVNVPWLLAKAFRFGLVEWVNRPPAPPRQPRT